MKGIDLGKLTVSQLVDHFTKLALEQYEAELYDETAKYNRLYDKIIAIRDELKGRSGDQRSALVPLFVHPNPQVRLKAAIYALAVAPAAARQALQEISDRNEYPQAADARFTLEAIERDDFNLT
jgi:hypothetical protein